MTQRKLGALYLKMYQEDASKIYLEYINTLSI